MTANAARTAGRRNLPRSFMTPAAVFRMLMLPPASMFFLLLLGWLAARRWPRAGRALVVAAIAGLYFLCTPAGADLLVAPLERLSPAARPQDLAGAQAIVVLAAGRNESAPEYGGAHAPDMLALARLAHAARLAHLTGLPILVTGGNRAEDAGHESKGAAMARSLREDFRTPVRWVEENSETTAENASRSAVILKAAGIARIILVTDAMHMSRAAPMFVDAGFQVVPAPMLYFQLRRHDVPTFFPSAEGLRRSYYASYEWIGILWYRMRLSTMGKRITS